MLSTFLFAIMMDEFIRTTQNHIYWYMLFADNIVLVNETRGKVNAKLEI